MNSRRTFLVALPALALGVASSVALFNAQDNPANTADLFSGSDSAKTIEEIKKSFVFPADWTEEEFEGRKLLFALLVQPTDGISLIDVHGWIYSEHFKEWRRFLKVNTRHLGGAKLLLNNGIISIRGTAYGKFMASRFCVLTCGQPAMTQTKIDMKYHLSRPSGPLGFLLLLCLFSFSAVGNAATFIVDRTDDAAISACSAAANDCTLRGAITKANATTGADTINFSATVFAAPGPHVIALATELPHLTSDVTITGPGAGLLTVMEAGSNHLLTIFAVNSGVSATFSGLTISNGYDGIVNDGTVTATNCILSSSIYGILNHSTLTTTNCTLSSNISVAINNQDGALTATNCTLSGNYTCIVNFGMVTASNCNLSSNSGDGIANERTVTATNCTLSDNHQTGIYNNGTVTATNCTLSGNTDNGIFNSLSSNAVTIRDTLVVGNTTNVSGGFIDGGHNITSGTAAAAGLDPAGLQDNGGPTKTIALLPGSPAIDKGNSTLTTDQRDFSRPSGSAPDIGAFEFGSVPALSVNNPRSLPEGSASAPGSITFDITLSGASTQSVTVNYQTRDGINNPATAGNDYVAKSGKLTFAPGETLKRVTIQFIGDSMAEAKETFFFDLKTPTGAIITDNRGVGTIVNDDAASLTFENDEPSQ